MTGNNLIILSVLAGKNSVWKMLKNWLFYRHIATALIAESDGITIGYAIYYPVFASFSANGNVHLEDFFIKKEYRKMGYGMKFFEICQKV